MEIALKIPIRPTLLDMRLYESENFPLEYANSLRSTIYMIKLEKPVRFVTKKEGDQIRVTRTA